MRIIKFEPHLKAKRLLKLELKSILLRIQNIIIRLYLCSHDKEELGVVINDLIEDLSVLRDR